jgi:hypothetical protein
VLGAFYAPLLVAAPPKGFAGERERMRAHLARAAGAAPAAVLSWFSASDTHLGHDPALPNGTVVTSFTKNVWAISEMNGLPGTVWPAALGGGPVAAPAGVTVSGDLIDAGDAPGTAVNGCLQWANFTALYGLKGGDGLLKYRVYEGFVSSAPNPPQNKSLRVPKAVNPNPKPKPKPHTKQEGEPRRWQHQQHHAQ